MPVDALVMDTWPGLKIVLLAGDLIDPIIETAIDGFIGGMSSITVDVLTEVCMSVVVAVAITLDDGAPLLYAGDVPCSW